MVGFGLAIALLLQATAPQTVLPRNTVVRVAVNNDLSSKTSRAGETFVLTVVQDVTAGGQTVIPRGTPARGEITSLTTKGMLGKSGKMTIELRFVDLGSRAIPISGSYLQEGEGGTIATVGTAVLAGPFAFLVTGKSALIPRGRELEGRTTEDVPLKATSDVTAVKVDGSLPARTPARERHEALARTLRDIANAPRPRNAHDALGAGLAKFRGKPQQFAFNKIGYPDRKMLIGGVTVYSWTNNDVNIDGSALTCTVKIIVRAARIVDTDHSGNNGACARYAEAVDSTYRER